MGCNFNCVIVPAKIQNEKDLVEFYENYKNKLLEEYGEDFEGYTGNMAVDDDNLIIKNELKLEIKSKKELTQKDFDKYYDQLLELCTGHCEKWGPSIAVKIGKQWAICGAYSD